MSNERFAYVQIGAKNVEALADFYSKALDFVPADKDEWLCGKKGKTFYCPGYEDGLAPVFGFVEAENGAASKINDVGFAHLCFETRNVKAALKRFVKCGGTFVSTLKCPMVNPCVYCADPEGNIVEFHIPFPAEGTGKEKAVMAGSLLGLMADKNLRFIHVNIISEDWKKSIGFYGDICDSEWFGGMKDHSGGYKSKVIGIDGVHVVGQHLWLKGLGKGFPTLEIFTYSIPGNPKACDETELGINAIGFKAEDRVQFADEIVKAGGRIIETAADCILAADNQDGRIYIR